MNIRKTLKNLLLSNKDNNYRPYILRPSGIIIISLILIGLKFSLSDGFLLKTQLIQVQKEITSENIYKLTNDERVKNNVDTLAYSSLLEKAAMKKAQHMMDNDYWAHESPDGVTPWHWFKAVGYDYDQAGENLAVDFITSDGVMNGWMNSPTHRANILESEYTEVGVGILEGEFQGKISTLVVQMFGKPKAELASTDVTSKVEINTNTNYGDSSSAPITTIDPEPGDYTKPVVVTLTANQADADIYYVIGTSIPTTNDKKYDSPFLLTKSTTLSFFSVSKNRISENVHRVNFNILKKTSVQNNSATSVVITSPKTREVLNSKTVTIKGNATPLSTIDLYVNDNFIRSKDVNISGKFQLKDALDKEGKNEIKIMSGNIESKIFVILDEQEPEFTISNDYTVLEMDDYYELELSEGIVISPLIYTKRDWNTKFATIPLHFNIDKEGIKLK